MEANRIDGLMPVLIRSRLRSTCFHQRSLSILAQRMLDGMGEPDAELSLEFVGDGRMRQLNRQYRGKDRPTDVLAFSMREANSPATTLLGDVVISLHTAQRQAADRGWSLEQEIVRLLIHGILHLLGYDHERSEREANRMRRKESAIVRSLGRLPGFVTTKI